MCTFRACLSSKITYISNIQTHTGEDHRAEGGFIKQQSQLGLRYNMMFHKKHHDPHQTYYSAFTEFLIDILASPYITYTDIAPACGLTIKASHNSRPTC